MPLYRCRYLTVEGARETRILEADSLEDAKTRLLREKVLLLEISSFRKQPEKVRLDKGALVNFTRELGQLLNAGLPLYESLVTIEEKSRGTKQHPIFLDLCDQLKSGIALSDIMSTYPTSFNEVVISMVRSAEKTGDLASGFVEITKLLEYQQQLRRQLLQSLSYPLFLGGVSILVFSCLMFFVVPSIQGLFQDRELHPITKVVFGTSDFLRNYGVYLLISILCLVAGGIYFVRSPKYRYYIQKQLLRSSFLRKIILNSALIIFCRTVSVLVAGGIPLVEALKLTSEGIRYLPLKEAIETSQRKILEGKSFSEEMSKFPFIPSLVIRMLTIAEKTGKFSEMVMSCSVLYQEELDRNLRKLTTLLQPILLIALGVVVGVVLLSILIPITDVSSMLNY